MEIHVVSSYIQRFQKNFEKGLRCLYPMWVDFNDHMTTIARARNSVQTNSIDRKNRTHLRQWRPFPSCYHAILVINTICRLPMDWCGHGLQLLITNRHDGNGLAINMWNYLPPNVVLAILWLPNESLNLDAHAHPPCATWFGRKLKTGMYTHKIRDLVAFKPWDFGIRSF